MGGQDALDARRALKRRAGRSVYLGRVGDVKEVLRL
jgi:hypothetical protein